MIVESSTPLILKDYLESYGYEVKAIDESNLWAYKKRFVYRLLISVIKRV